MKEAISKKKLKVKSKKELIKLVKQSIGDYNKSTISEDDAVKKHKALLDDFNALKGQILDLKHEKKQLLNVIESLLEIVR